jgi:hypothetical protein
MGSRDLGEQSRPIWLVLIGGQTRAYRTTRATCCGARRDRGTIQRCPSLLSTINSLLLPHTPFLVLPKCSFPKLSA